MKVFLYDGTFEGLLTAVFDSYKEDATICRADCFERNLIDEPIYVETSLEKFNRLNKSIEQKLGSLTMRNVYYLFLSDVADSEDLVLRYLRLCYEQGSRINNAKNNDIILKVDKIAYKVGYEAHKFTGFVRFTEIRTGIFYSSIETDHNILPIIAGHFENRFSDQYFIIHDLKREIAIVYNKIETVFTPLSKEQGEKIMEASKDSEVEELWKNFYDAIMIKERKNDKLRRQFMPARYWKHLTEFK